METATIERPLVTAGVERAVWSHQFTWMIAGAGWGKSDALRQWQEFTSRADDVTCIPESLLTSDSPDDGRLWFASEAAKQSSRHGRVIVIDLDGAMVPSAAVAALLDAASNGTGRLRILYSAREAPAAATARLRTQGRSVHLDEHDLTFTADDIRRLHAGVDAGGVLRTTSGWPTGVRVVLGDENDSAKAELLRQYFEEEVLSRLEADVRALLLECAVLDRLSGRLCQAVTQRTTDQTPVLHELVRRHAFCTQVGDRGRWYRLHPQLLQALRGQASVDGIDVRVAHKRAAEWFALHGAGELSVPHLIAAEMYDDAARMIGDHHWRLVNQGGSRRVNEWIDRLPADALRTQPYTLIAQATARLMEGRTEDVAGVLMLAERTGDDAQVVLGRATLAAIRGDVGTAFRLADAARDALPTTAVAERASCAAVAAGAAYYRGDANAGDRFAAIATSTTPLNNIAAEVASRAMLARLCAESGDLQRADELLRAVALREARGGLPPFLERLVLLVRGSVLASQGSPSAYPLLQDAYTSAVAASDVLTAADAAVTLAEIARGANRMPQAPQWQLRADQQLLHCPDPGARLRERRAQLSEPPGTFMIGGHPVRLTERQLQVMRAVARGLSDAQIAEELAVSVRTVNAHVRDVIARLGASSRTDAARRAGVS